MIILAIDPGRDAGYSLWSTDAGLLLCGLNGLFPLRSPQDVLVIEIPEVYPHTPSPQSLITLSVDAGIRMGRETYSRAFGFFPKTWKKQISKEAHHRIVQESLSAMDLDIIERGLRKVAPSKVHNVWDAVALGQWATKRAKVLHTMADLVFPGSSG